MLDSGNPSLQFAADEIKKSLKASGHEPVERTYQDIQLEDEGTGPIIQIVLGLLSNQQLVSAMQGSGGGSGPLGLKAEGFAISITSTDGILTYWILGQDYAGAMYGGLEAAEIILTSGLSSIQDDEQNPYFSKRGVKFNIPLDLRTPSYSDMSDAAQNNIKEMWNLDFWTEYIDLMARFRYNHISLWNMHPFPSLVKVPGYENVALNDVWRSTGKFDENYSVQGMGIVTDEMLNNKVVELQMTIDEKIAFWRKVMKYGRERNVEFWFITWNIFTYGATGKYGINDDGKNTTTIDYFRKSVKALITTYPDLGGIGLTTGENMGVLKTSQEKEDWAFKTYGLGALDAVKEIPVDRKLMFVHRQHQTGATDIKNTFTQVINNQNIEFILSFKYAQAHVMAATKWDYHTEFVKDIQGEGLKTTWTLRNDDNYYFRWGAPDFVREFIKNIPYDVTRGFYYGSDQYIWGREFLDKEPESPRQLEVDKHWYHWMMWGRLSYNPALPNERFEKILSNRFPGTNASDLFTAWQEASMIYPKTTSVHWGQLDVNWYIECCRDRQGFHGLDGWLNPKVDPRPAFGTQSVRAYGENPAMTGRTPIVVSNEIHAHADKALQMVANMPHGGNKELRKTLLDIRTMATLGKYYGHKMAGASYYAARAKGGAYPSKAVDELQQAARYWRQYTALATSQYTNPLWLNRVGICDWRKQMQGVLADIKQAGGSEVMPSVPPTLGGTLLEAETASLQGVSVATANTGFTGAGYADFNASAGKGSLEWTFTAPEEAQYTLEFRYALDEGEKDALIEVNGNKAGNLKLWTTVDVKTWAFDQITVPLKQGSNTIKMTPGIQANIDHLNILHAGSSVSIAQAGLLGKLKAPLAGTLFSNGLMVHVRSSVPVTVEIFNVRGEVLKARKTGILSSGLQFVEFTGNPLSHGVYYVRLSSEKYSKTEKRMALGRH